MSEDKKYQLISENNESTVVSNYVSPYARETNYQSEADLEREMIKQLKRQAYDFLSIKSEADLIQNLRTQLEELNDYKFTDTEWRHFFTERIANGTKTYLRKLLKFKRTVRSY